MALALPVVLRFSQNWRLLETPGVQNTIAGITLAIIAGFFAWRAMDHFPTVQGSAYVLWGFVPVYLIIMAAFLLFRLDYNRYLFFTSLIACLAWFLAVHFTLRQYLKPSFSIVPGGKVDDLVKIDHVRWITLHGPDDFIESHDGLNDKAEPGAPGAPGANDQAIQTPHLLRAVPGRHGIVADLRYDHSPQWQEFFAAATLSGIPVYHHKQIEELLTGKVMIEHLSENNFGSLLPDMLFLKIKQMIDLCVTVFCLPILLPVLGLVSILIYLKDGRPIFFFQKRIGYRGAVFTVCKFRTMVINSKAGASILDIRDQGFEGALVRHSDMTRKNDARVTPLGGFLRKTRIDELPQIINILKGQMSWIGPRPETIALSKFYSRELPFYAYRHAVRPGISGWAQVNQGHVTGLVDVYEKLKYDFYYIKHASPWLDFLIALKTLRILVTGFGAK